MSAPANFSTYNTRVQVLKAQGETAKNEWNRFKSGPASQNKLKVLRAYIAALNAEYNYRKNFWNPAWGPQDTGHAQRLVVLQRDAIELERQEALLDRQVNH